MIGSWLALVFATLPDASVVLAGSIGLNRENVSVLRLDLHSGTGTSDKTGRGLNGACRNGSLEARPPVFGLNQLQHSIVIIIVKDNKERPQLSPEAIADDLVDHDEVVVIEGCGQGSHGLNEVVGPWAF